MIQHYYLSYNEELEKLSINYRYVLRLYQIASYDKARNRYCIIKFDSKASLLRRFNEGLKKQISITTLYNFLEDKRYNKLFEYHPEEKTIEILNDIKKKKSFVVLTAAEASLIIENDNKLFAKYLLYLKYYCGKSKSKKIDTTAGQVLEACGYCKNSMSYKNKLTEFNAILCDNGLLSIEHYIDEGGRYRNVYCYN